MEKWLLEFDHYAGITFITLAFVYLIIMTFKNNKAYAPPYFYILYGIGGFLIFLEMFYTQEKYIVFELELVGVIIAAILAIHSFQNFKK